METEPIDDVTNRAQVHAALGDPARLRIVDALGLGDASPSELARLLTMPSNLLAHHLRVLEDADLVTRRRSDGDARRAYLRLRTDVLGRLVSSPQPRPRRVVFVCTANSARSHLAAAVWRSAHDLPVASAGTHPAKRIAPGAIRAARRRRLPLERVEPVAFTAVVRKGDLLVSVCDQAHEELDGVDQLHWSIPDPVAIDTVAAYDAVIDELDVRVQSLAERLG